MSESKKFAAVVSEAILGGRATWDRLYAKNRSQPMTDEDREALALMMEEAKRRQSLSAPKA